LLVESVIYTQSSFDREVHNRLFEKNKTLLAEYEKLKQNGDARIYYLSSEDLIGGDGEATVDGVHLTDLGFERFSEILLQKINSIFH
jgi:hypothetical protein